MFTQRFRFFLKQKEFSNSKEKSSIASDNLRFSNLLDIVYNLQNENLKLKTHIKMLLEHLNGQSECICEYPNIKN